MNSDGGALVIGVKENKSESDYEIIGIEKGLGKFLFFLFSCGNDFNGLNFL